MIKKLGFFILLFCCAVALDMYDENRAFGMDQNDDENYNKENYDYENLEPFRPEIRDDQLQSLILYQLFNSLQNRDDARLRLRYRPKFSMVENALASYGHVPYSELMDLKGAVVKRRLKAPANAPGTVKNNGDPVTPANPDSDVRKRPLNWCPVKLLACSWPRPLKVAQT